MARLSTVKNTADRLERQVLNLIFERCEKYDSRTERWQRSRRGKEFKLDTYLLKKLAAELQDFNGAIEQPTGEEE